MLTLRWICRWHITWPKPVSLLHAKSSALFNGGCKKNHLGFFIVKGQSNELAAHTSICLFHLSIQIFLPFLTKAYEHKLKFQLQISLKPAKTETSGFNLKRSLFNRINQRTRVFDTITPCFNSKRLFLTT